MATLQCFSALLFIGLPLNTALSQVIPASRTTSWIPGVTVGKRGAIPVRTNLLDVTRYGATTNNGYVLGTIAAGNNVMTVSSVGDFAVGHGIWVSNVYSTVITNITGNTFKLRDNSPANVNSLIVRHDNGPVINSVISQAQSNDVVYIPAGNYVARSGFGSGGKEYFSIRGAPNSKIVLLGNGGIVIGPTPLSQFQGKDYPVPAGVFKGSNQLVVPNIIYTNTPYPEPMRVGELYTLSTLNGEDPNFRTVSVYGYERVLSQTIVIENIQGNVVTFSPPVVWNFTNKAHLVQLAARGSRGVGLENLSVTLTNAGEASSPYAIVDSVLCQQLVDSWITGCTSAMANNYNLHISGCVSVDVRSNTIAKSLTKGTSHAGLLIEQSSGLLVENNIFDSFDFALQLWGPATMGCAYFGNFFTNTTATAIFFHSTHHMMNLFEANVLDSAFLIDGYYGANSHATLLRNRIASTISLKRFTSYISVVGNVLGSTTYNYYYDRYSQSSGQWPIFELGNPNIGNASSTGVSPPMSWNYPQTSFLGNHGDPAYRDRIYTNCSYTFTSTLVNVTNIPGNFAHWPYSPYGGYSLIFQDPVNTNLYHRLADTVPPVNQINASLRASAPPTSTGMQLSAPMTISNGWKMLVSSADTFQQRQSIDDATQIRHGNYVYTNMIGSTMWDPAITDQSIPASLLYTNGPPSWWGSSPWPAIGPDLTPIHGTIPAQARYLGIVTNVVDQTAPSVPQALTATAASATQVNLSWNASTDNIGVTGYRIERSTGSGSTSFVEIANAAGTSYADTGLTSSTTYNYRIRAVDATGNTSAFSATATANTPVQTGDQTPPTAPSAATATANSSSQIAVSWSAASDNVGVVGYRLEQSIGSGANNFVEIATLNGTTYTASALNSATTYNYRVRAFDAAGNVGTYSAVATATTTAPGGDQTPPSTPTTVTATTASSTQMNVSWAAATDNVGVTGYRLERSVGSGSTAFAQIATPTGTSFLDSALNSATVYNYRVRAVDASGNFSAYSLTATGTTAAPGGDQTAPSTPTAPTVTTVSPRHLRVQWVAATDNVGVAGYRLEQSIGSGSTTFAEIANLTNTSFLDSALNSATTYNYRVRAYDAAGNVSAYSSVSTGTTAPPDGDTTPPSTPTPLIAAAVSASQIGIGWGAATDNIGVAGYRVERSTGAGSVNFTEIAVVSATAFNDLALAANTVYNYRVRAFDGTGNLGGYSTTATATTLGGTSAPSSPGTPKVISTRPPQEL